MCRVQLQLSCHAQQLQARWALTMWLAVPSHSWREQAERHDSIAALAPTLIPIQSMRACSRALSSSKPTAGRATNEVSSKKTLQAHGRCARVKRAAHSYLRIQLLGERLHWECHATAGDGLWVSLHAYMLSCPYTCICAISMALLLLLCHHLALPWPQLAG